MNIYRSLFLSQQLSRYADGNSIWSQYPEVAYLFRWQSGPYLYSHLANNFSDGDLLRQKQRRNYLDSSGFYPCYYSFYFRGFIIMKSLRCTCSIIDLKPLAMGLVQKGFVLPQSLIFPPYRESNQRIRMRNSPTRSCDWWTILPDSDSLRGYPAEWDRSGCSQYASYPWHPYL